MTIFPSNRIKPAIYKTKIPRKQIWVVRVYSATPDGTFRDSFVQRVDEQQLFQPGARVEELFTAFAFNTNTREDSIDI